MSQPDPARSLRVLFLSGHQIYPTTSGGTLKSFALANGLQRHGFDVRVHSLTGRRADYQARRRSSVHVWPGGVTEYVDRSLRSMVAWMGGYVIGLPPIWISAQLATAAALPRAPLLSAELRQSLQWCDAIVADYPFVYPIFSTPAARGKLRVLSTQNVEHHLLDDLPGWTNRLLRRVVRDLELRAASASEVLVSCCAEDARFFRANAAVRHVVVVPHGFDLRRFDRVGADRAAARSQLGLAEDVKLFLFTASRWGPNREAFDYLRRFAQTHAALLADERIHILVAGNVVPDPVRLPGFTATGHVERMEPYFAAADAAINPMLSGAGTNVKMSEFIALRLPILSTAFGARGFVLEDGKTGFLFDRDELASALARVRRLFDEDPALLRRVADEAYARNESLIDLDAGVRRLAEAVRRQGRPRGPDAPGDDEVAAS